MARQIRKQIASMMQDITSSELRVASDCTLKPRMSLKSVRPLLPPKPKLLRKKPSSSA